MGIMKHLDELEQELYENGEIHLSKDNSFTPTALCWFRNTENSENYSGIFKGVHLNIKELEKEYIITYNKNDVESVYKSSMNGLKKELSNIIELLRGD